MVKLSKEMLKEHCQKSSTKHENLEILDCKNVGFGETQIVSE